jgi:hypothetical protein
MFNPWSVSQYIIRGKLAEYWTTSALIGSLNLFLTPHVQTILVPILDLLFENGKYRVKTLRTQVNYTSDSRWELNSILHFLVLAGYMDYTEEEDGRYVSIPNKEVHMCLTNEVRNLMGPKIEPHFLYRIQQATRKLDIEELQNTMKQMVLAPSTFDLLKNYENCYHLFFFGAFLTALHNEEDILVTSNRELGHGRLNVRIDFRRQKQAVIFEFKHTDAKTNLKRDAEDALKQIKDQEYYADLRNYKCCLIGVSFIMEQMSSFGWNIIQTS